MGKIAGRHKRRGSKHRQDRTAMRGVNVAHQQVEMTVTRVNPRDLPRTPRPPRWTPMTPQDVARLKENDP